MVLSCCVILSVVRDRWEQYFIISGVGAPVNISGPESSYYTSYSNDFNGAAMRGYPGSGIARKFSFCIGPGEYTLHAIDTGGHGWWGGAFYSVTVNGAVVINEEMGHESSSLESTSFTVVLPLSARTAFTDNKAAHGGGGAVFWEKFPPKNIKNYLDESTSNLALYGDFVATPARELAATNHSYRIISGNSMTDPVTVELRDRQG